MICLETHNNIYMRSDRAVTRFETSITNKFTRYEVYSEYCGLNCDEETDITTKNAINRIPMY